MSAYRKATINGVKVWAAEKDVEIGYSLAKANHVRDGELCVPFFFGMDSYAHVYPDGEILRYGEKIGMEADLVEGWED